jgi:AraC-like DNA-binding protein/ligand-binding sensor domain-containing protein
VKYDEGNGVSSSHITQLLQDELGFMWFSTWNGLCRYDGYEFRTFKPAVGDGCHMSTDRIRDISLLPGGQILCQTDEGYYWFNLHNYQFRDLSDKEQAQAADQIKSYRQSHSLLSGKTFQWTDAQQTRWTLHSDGKLTYLSDAALPVDYPLAMDFHTLSFMMVDHQGNLWALDNGSIYKFCTDIQRTHQLTIEPREEVKCLFGDRQGRYWVATKGDQALRIYDGSNDRLIGYLGRDGRIHQGYTRFGAAVYCMYESKDGTLWLGCKPDGIFRLCPINTTPDRHFSFLISNFSFPFGVYHIAEDRYGRVWVATLGGGICYTNNPQAEKPTFMVPRQFSKDKGQRVRYLHFTKGDVMLAASGSGLWVARQEKDADKMRFRLHERESERANSLSCSATMDVTEDAQGRLFISTESGGINQIMSQNLLADTLSFRHFNDSFHAQGSDIVQSLTLLPDNGLIAVGSHLVTLMDNNLNSRVLDARYFQKDYRFSEAHPLALGHNRWLFGLTDGAFITTIQQKASSTAKPRLVLTSVSVQGGNSDYAIGMADSIVLSPDERSLTVRFAALDYSAAERISYAFRLSTDSQWHYIGHDRSATLLDLKPGTYQLEIRSTNADGEWQDNVRSMTIIVTPTFWEAWYGQLLIVLICLALLAAILYTYLYIRRIKRQQRETLEKYLAMIEDRGEKEEVRSQKEEGRCEKEETKDPVLERVMSYLEEHLSDSDIGVGDMAAAAATSRSGLQRKLKQTMGITPQDLLREARIKRACQLLRTSNKTVAEVAYACGFSDPKYFSRSFKQSTGQSPTEFKNASN